MSTIYRTLQGEDVMGPGFLVFFRRLGRIQMGGPSNHQEQVRQQEGLRELEEERADEALVLLMLAIGVNPR